MEENSNIQKVCGFYVSNMHFATMILPYVNKKTEEQNKIITFFENDFTINIELVLSRLNITEERKRELLNVKWKDTSISKASNIEKILKDEVDRKNDNIIIISGREEYIKSINVIIEKYIIKNSRKVRKVKIIDLYEAGNFNENVQEILDRHEMIFNTAGEHLIEEVFEEYRKVRVNAK